MEEGKHAPLTIMDGIIVTKKKAAFIRRLLFDTLTSAGRKNANHERLWLLMLIMIAHILVVLKELL